MSKKKKKKVSFFIRLRISISIILFGSILLTLLCNFAYSLKEINQLNNKKRDLKEEKIVLKEEAEKLESDVEKLKDPDYIAKYVREKYLYSKDNELIIRIEENTED